MNFRKHATFVAGALALVPICVITVLAIVFLMGIEIPLPLSHAEKAELAAYAPDEGTSIFKGAHWQMEVGNYQLEAAEFILVSAGKQLEIRHFILPRITKKLAPAPHIPIRYPLTLA